MKQFLLGLGFSVAFIVGCATATIAQSSAVSKANAAPPDVQKWEYNCPQITHDKSYNRKLAEAGAEGWELVTAEATCLKRPL